LKKQIKLFFSLFATLALAQEPKNLHYFLKNDKMKLKVSSGVEKDIYVNMLDVDRDVGVPHKIGDENFGLVDTVSLNNAIELDLQLTDTFKFTTAYNYNLNDYQIEEQISNLGVEKDFKKFLISVKYENLKSTDMLEHKDLADSDIYSVVLNHKPHNDNFNKRVKVKLDWIKSKGRYKFDKATVLRAKYKGGKLYFELNMKFATE